jgi:hypothetical protein
MSTQRKIGAQKKRPRPSKRPNGDRRRGNPAVPAARKPGSPRGPGQEQDVKRRMGTFTNAGEHARVGSRTAGIIGQTKRAFQTDHKRTKSKASFGKPDKSRGGRSGE